MKNNNYKIKFLSKFGSLLGLTGLAMAPLTAVGITNINLNNEQVTQNDSLGLVGQIFELDSPTGAGKLQYAVLSEDVINHTGTVNVDCNSVGELKGALEIPTTVDYNGFKYAVTEISDYAFASSTELTSIIIPDNVTSIGWSAFNSCTGLTSITIPDSVTQIGNNAFGNCKGLENITLPSKLTEINSNLFNSCLNLVNITIPDSVVSIGMYAFSECVNLKNVTIGSSVTTIYSSSFSNCLSLTSIIIPDKITSIEDSAFKNCILLSSVIVEAIIPPEIRSGNVFENTSPDLKIYVPASSVEKYKTTKGWSENAGKILPIPPKPIDSTDNNLAIIIGCSIGGVMLLGGITAGTIIYIKKHHKNKK